jgi:DNA polymerase-1
MICAACLEVARTLDRGWLQAWPEQSELFKMASTFTAHKTRVEVEIPGGQWPILRGECGYTQFLNTPFQGLGARVVKDAMWRVCREMYVDRQSPLFGSRMVLNVHDELVSELPLDRAHEAAERKALIMRETAARWMPDLGPSIEADPAISLVMAKR